MEVKKILIGMFRPLPADCGGKDNLYYHCKCMDPQIAGVLRSHGFMGCYNAGHFDEPVYKYVWEENGQIKESLTDPNKKCA